MRIAFLTPWDPQNERSWSGVVKPMFDALSGVAEIVPVGTGDIRDALPDRVLCRLLNGWGGKQYLVGHAVATSIKRGVIVSRSIRAVAPDVIVAVAASQDVAFLRTDVPIVLVSDTTLDGVLDVYPQFTGLLAVSRLQARIQSRLSARRASRSAAMTTWARDRLIADDGFVPDSVTVVPMGPGIEPPEVVREPWQGRPLRLLVVSSDWKRKGGDAAVATFRELQRRGRDVTLTVVGVHPELDADITALGRVSKAELLDLYFSHDVLVELAECNTSGVTLADAACCGLPVVATGNGGVPTVVDDGVSGLLVDAGPRLASDAADAVERLMVPGRHAEMSQAALARGRDVINWAAWARGVLDECERVVTAV